MRARPPPEPEPAPVNTPATRAARVKSLAREVGFDLVGVTGTSVPEAFARYLEAVERGHCADMRYLFDRPELRRDVREVWPQARSVIALAVSYASSTPSILEAPPGPDEGYIARYARGRDYHLVVKKMLVALARRFESDALLAGHPSTAHRLFVDTGPVLEKAFAMAAGLGWIGKNTLLIHPGHRVHPTDGRTVGRGSYYFLAVILTPLELAHDTPEFDHCGSCRRCLEVCPTQAFPAPYELDARRCISTWTIESEDPAAVIDPATIGPHVFGCDLCQEVCPWNRGVERRRAGEAMDPDAEPAVSLRGLLEAPDGELRERYDRLYLPRNDPRYLRRNALVAAGNSGDPGLRALAERYAASGDELLSEHAGWALERLSVA